MPTFPSFGHKRRRGSHGEWSPETRFTTIAIGIAAIAAVLASIAIAP
jgi:hypothetical protein